MALEVLAALYGTPARMSPLEQTVMTVSINSEQDRIDAYTRAQEAVAGIFPDPLKTYPGEPRDIVKVNAIKPIVDATVNYLFGKPPEWQIPQEQDVAANVEPPAPGPPPQDVADGLPVTSVKAKAAQKKKSPEEEWLEECLRVNRFPQFLLDFGYNGATCGTPFYAIDSDDRLPNRLDKSRPFPRFYVTDPAAMSIKTDPANIDKTVRYEWRYLSYDPTLKRPCVDAKIYERADDGQSWTISLFRSYYTPGLYATNNVALYGSMMEGSSWQPVGAPVLWPYEWPPVDHCKNLPAPNQVYGSPDVTDILIDANHAINFSLSNDQRIFKQNGHPIIFLENFNGDISQLDFSVGSINGLPSNGQTPVHAVQLTPAVNVQASQMHRQEISHAMENESATPSIVLGEVSRADGVPSGIALRIRMEPMLQKTETKRKSYEPLLIELFRRLFVLGGFADDILVTLIWPELVPIDNLEERQALQIDDALGLASKETLSNKLGYEYEDEQARIQQEKAAAAASSAALPPSPGAPAPPPGSDNAPQGRGAPDAGQLIQQAIQGRAMRQGGNMNDGTNGGGQ